MQQFLKYYTKDNQRFVFLDGKANNTIEETYANLYTQLSIPDYFGANLDAFEEVMNDLEWIEENKISFIILHADEFLKNDEEKKQILLDIINQSSVENVTIEVIIIQPS